MSKSPLYRAGVNAARKQYEAGAAFAGKQYEAGVAFAGKQYEAGAAFADKQARAGAAFARKYPRVSMIATVAATAGVLSAATFAGGAAPGTQAIGNVSSSTQSAHQANSDQYGNIFADVTSTSHTGTTKSMSSTQLDSLNSATPGVTATAAAAGNSQHGKQAAAVSEQSAKAAPAKAAPAKAVTAVKAKAAQPKPQPKPKKPYIIYDSVTPSSIPAGQPAAVYADGAYAASASQVAGHHDTIWIDTNGSDPKANVLDVEPGDATPAGAAQWVQQRLTEQPKSNAIVYTMLSDWSQVKANVGQLPSWMQAKVRYWIADPTGVPHVVAGSSATQWYWGTNYDLTTANWNF